MLLGLAKSNWKLLPMAALMLMGLGCLKNPGSLVGDSSNSSQGTASFQFEGATSAFNLNDRRIQVQWNKSTDSALVTYRVYRLKSDGSIEAIGTVPNTLSQFIVSNLTPGTYYSFLVRGADSEGNTDKNNKFVSAFTYAGLVEATVLSSTSAQLTFAAAPDATALKIYCATGSSTDYLLMASVDSTRSSYTLTGLTGSTLYSCKVKAVALDQSEDSNTAVVSFTPDLAFTGATQALVLNANQVQITWNPGAGASISSYRIYELGSDGVSKTLITTVLSTAQSFTINGVTQVPHTYLVRAVSSSGNEDGNNVHVVAFPYGGVTSFVVDNSAQATFTFPSAVGATFINIFCKTSTGVYPSIPNAQVSSLQTTATVTGLLGASTYICKAEPEINGVSYANSATVSFYLPDLAFNGVLDAVGLSGTQVTLSWAAGSGAEISNYRVYEVSADGSSRTLVATLPFATLTYTVGSLSSALHYFQVKAVSSSGVEDSNNVKLANIPYLGVTAVAPVNSSTVTVYFPASAGADKLRIYCKKSWEASYSSTAHLEVAPTLSSANLNLVSGRSYTCIVKAIVNSVPYSNLASNSFQTISNTSLTYNGVILASAYGAAPTAPSGPTANQVILAFKYFGTSASATQSYSVVRTLKGAPLDATSTTACTSAVTTSCRVCLLTNVTNSQTCTDTNVDASPRQYDYAITLMSSDGVAEELPAAGDTDYRITIPIPPANMVLVQRDSANYEMCNLMGRTTDPLNHQRCAYTGLGAVPYNAGPGKPALNLPAGYYDFGYNLFVDRWEAACNWNSFGVGAPSGAVGAVGDIYYDTSSANCHIKNTSSTWTTVNNGSVAISTLRAGAYTNAPSSTSRRPPMVQLDQVAASNTCKSINDSNYGAKRLLRKREFNLAAAWPTLLGDYGSMTDAEATAIEGGSGNGHPTAAGTYRCNTDTHAGIATSTFNSSGYELSRDTSAGGPDSFIIGSEGTKNCISRFGAQDIVGNVYEFVSDQISNTGSYIATGVTSSLDNGNTDLLNFNFNGTQGVGGGSSQPGEYALDAATPLTVGGNTYSALYFSAPLGIPIANSDNGNAMLIGTAITSTKLRGDYISYYFSNNAEAPSNRSVYVGGAWVRGSQAGRWEVGFKNSTTTAGNNIGFRCALSAD